MRNNKDLRQQSYCRACGLVVVDSVCPYCGSTIDEPVIYESKIRHRSRFTSITGVVLLIVAGVTPAVVSASETNETSSESSPSAVVSTTIPTAPVMESTSTTLVQSSEKNITQNTKTPTTQKPKKKQSSPSGSVYVAPPTTTTVPPGPHGKIVGNTSFWRNRDSGLEIFVQAGKYSDGSEYVAAFLYFPSAKSLDSSCSESSAPIYKYESFESVDAGATVEPYYETLIPTKNIGCESGGLGLSSSGFREGNWRDMKRKVVPVPVNFYAKVKLTNLRSGKVDESPWVLIDWGKVP